MGPVLFKLKIGNCHDSLRVRQWPKQVRSSSTFKRQHFKHRSYDISCSTFYMMHWDLDKQNILARRMSNRKGASIVVVRVVRLSCYCKYNKTLLEISWPSSVNSNTEHSVKTDVWRLEGVFFGGWRKGESLNSPLCYSYKHLNSFYFRTCCHQR